MATYAIGDLHGCYDQLQKLLSHIQFNPNTDTLWFTGDLINGGPKPTEILRFIKSLGDKHITVLGNHDLVLLGVAAGKLPLPQDRAIGFEPVLNANDKDELLAWLQTRPLVHFDPNFNALLVHAGVHPQWDIQTIQQLAREVEAILHSSEANNLYGAMYGDYPTNWDPELTGWDRYRYIINCFTRIRFCDQNGNLDFITKGNTLSAPPDYMPWYNVPQRKMDQTKIIFGHWSSLLGNTGVDTALAIDTGCVWGHHLTALRLDDWQLFSVPY